MSRSNEVWYRRWLTACLVHLLVWGLRLLYSTLRSENVQQCCEQRAWRGGTPVLLAFWHGRMLYFLHRYHRQRFTMLVSRSKDGEFVSRVLQRFGVHVTRGSSSQGGAQGLRAIVREIRSGYNAGFTPDGPRGPRYTLQPGIVSVAKMTGAAILPVTYSARWKKVFRSWDAFLMPLPFSRVVVVYGEPIYVPAAASATIFHAKRDEVEASLRHITEMADDYCASRRRRD
jgi:lysophospholipid acyltransferase (LPLAT)-like uncharacterized protein